MTRTHIRPDRQQRGGRSPTFYQYEVDAIREDNRSSATVADEYGVSYETIQRVRGRGRFAGVPYIAKEQAAVRRKYPDLLDDTPVEDVLAAHFKAFEPPPPDPFNHLNNKPKRVGRKFLSGRAPLTLDEIAAILVDKRPPRTIARDWHLQSNYVMKLKRDYANEQDYADRVEQVRERVLSDTRDVKTLAMVYKLPAKVIQEIKNAGPSASDTQHSGMLSELRVQSTEVLRPGAEQSGPDAHPARNTSQVATGQWGMGDDDGAA